MIINFPPVADIKWREFLCCLNPNTICSTTKILIRGWCQVNKITNIVPLMTCSKLWWLESKEQIRRVRTLSLTNTLIQLAQPDKELLFTTYSATVLSKEAQVMAKTIILKAQTWEAFTVLMDRWVSVEYTAKKVDNKWRFSTRNSSTRRSKNGSSSFSLCPSSLISFSTMTWTCVPSFRRRYWLAMTCLNCNSFDSHARSSFCG